MIISWFKNYLFSPHRFKIGFIPEREIKSFITFFLHYNLHKNDFSEKLLILDYLIFR